MVLVTNYPKKKKRNNVFKFHYQLQFYEKNFFFLVRNAIVIADKLSNLFVSFHQLKNEEQAQTFICCAPRFLFFIKKCSTQEIFKPVSIIVCFFYFKIEFIPIKLTVLLYYQPFYLFFLSNLYNINTTFVFIFIPKFLFVFVNVLCVSY